MKKKTMMAESPMDTQDATDVAIEAMNLYEMGEHARALRLTRQYLASDGEEDAEVWTLHAMLAMELDNVAEADAAISCAEDLVADDELAMEVRSLVNERKRLALGAKNLHEQSWRADGNDVENGLALHRSLRAIGQVEEANALERQLRLRFRGDDHVRAALNDARFSDSWIHARTSQSKAASATSDGRPLARHGFTAWLKRFLNVTEQGRNPFAGLGFGQKMVLGGKWMLAVICICHVAAVIVGALAVCVMEPAGWLLLGVAALVMTSKARGKQHGRRKEE
ncbi:hypothetical protein D2E22_1201 [Bifidobacterium castoris]|uniref:Tetratricopeptide repeat protein n=2 Tax=Bifidobacterium castoris TaxID=2306972 RepID=A0A430F7L3_9BIFI|nr:hypothetical protein D2E22_1201 [Bifidobacterium castoris]